MSYTSRGKRFIGSVKKILKLQKQSYKLESGIGSQLENKEIGASYHHRNLMEKVFVLWKLEVKRHGMLLQIFIMKMVLSLEPPSKESYEKKLDFERR